MKKSLLTLILAVASIAYSSPYESKFFIFIKNPGVGKSTIINSLVDEQVAPAGVSAGVGLTQFFTAYEHADVTYLDTPGLADVQRREEAALEIEKALKQDGTYHIFFVVKLIAGRVSPEDVTTINTVMNAIKIENAQYNIIINNLTPKEKHHILRDEVKMAAVYSQLNAGDHKTNSIAYIENNRRIDDEETELIPIDTLLAAFFYQMSKSIIIHNSDVVKIETNEFDKIKQEFESTISTLNAQIHAGNARYQQLFDQMRTVQENLARAQKEISEGENQIIRLGQDSQTDDGRVCCLD